MTFAHVTGVSLLSILLAQAASGAALQVTSLEAMVSANASAGDVFGGSDSDMQCAMASSFAELPISAQADASVSIASASALR
ncbi:MAG: hypothetical protein EA376_11870 [Phycisphaeraceae bacterium]|nr:MAG: hypothetical protein EA376_11870 [Phycisphaeraceae bacterium]